MKFNHISKALMVLAMGGAMVSCNDLLDQEPQSSITPESYYKAEDQIQACANSFYGNLPSHGYGYGLYSSDTNTDNQAGFEGDAIDPMTTINATDMSKETLDWGAYSAGRLLDDPVLFNIRRERRDELMGEALRWMDLQRWRALDQMMTTRYHVEGMKLWNSEMTAHYNFKEADYNGDAKAKVSAPGLSDYLRIYEKNMTANNLYRDGYTWHLAHYLQPMPIKEMMLTAPDYTTVSESSLYQNPYWPTETDKPAEK